jgi:septation ring formation regulator EzrA
MKKINNREFILVFALIIVFVVSMSVAYISKKADRMESRIDYVDKNVNKIIDRHGD